AEVSPALPHRHALSSWPCVSRPPTPGRWDGHGGSTTASAWVAGTHKAMTISGRPSSRHRLPCCPCTPTLPLDTPRRGDMALPARQRLPRLVRHPPFDRPTIATGDIRQPARLVRN